jgi:hypothetical protein
VSNLAQTAASSRAMFGTLGPNTGRVEQGSTVMTTAADYRGFAMDCFHWAEQANDASQRLTLTQIAHLWKNIAIKMDQYVTLAGDGPAQAKILHLKLN